MGPIVQATPESPLVRETPIVVGNAAISKLKQSVSASLEKSDPDAWLSAGLDSSDAATPAKETIAQLGRDDRKSTRCNVPPARQSCTLKVGGNLAPALVVDKSAGGFAVLIDNLDGLKVGTKSELHTDSGKFKVRIVYINKVARPLNAPAGSPDSWYRLGTKKQRSFILF
jgi:hypothetical protein